MNTGCRNFLHFGRFADRTGVSLNSGFYAGCFLRNFSCIPSVGFLCDCVSGLELCAAVLAVGVSGIALGGAGCFFRITKFCIFVISGCRNILCFGRFANRAGVSLNSGLCTRCFLRNFSCIPGVGFLCDCLSGLELCAAVFAVDVSGVAFGGAGCLSRIAKLCIFVISGCRNILCFGGFANRAGVSLNSSLCTRCFLRNFPCIPGVDFLCDCFACLELCAAVFAVGVSGVAFGGAGCSFGISQFSMQMSCCRDFFLITIIPCFASIKANTTRCTCCSFFYRYYIFMHMFLFYYLCNLFLCFISFGIKYTNICNIFS